MFANWKMNSIFGTSVLIGVWEHISFICGCIIFCTLMPLVGPVVFVSVVWEAVDRGFKGGFVESNAELSGNIFKFAKYFNQHSHNFNAKFVKNSSDSFFLNCVLLQGVIIPIVFALCLWHSCYYGFSLPLCFVFHVLRIGPYFMNFAYYYTLCHKEAHTRQGFFVEPYHTVLRHVFNWWISLFYGVMPGAFAIGHSLNHHRYNNGYFDVVSTGDKPRDSLVYFIAYLPRWLLYSLNISTLNQFYNEGKYDVAFKVLFGSAYWWTFFTVVACFNPIFAVGYVLYPFAENVLILAAINWCWHAFGDPHHTQNDYVTSLTILNSPMNILNENLHVVHHQYPNAHWTSYPKRMMKHWNEYVEQGASVFSSTHAFELFMLIIMKNYESLADRFVDLQGEKTGSPLNQKGKVKLLKERLRVCTWGPRSSHPE